MRMLARLIPLLLAGVAPLGCAFPRAVVNDTLEFNTALAATQNDQLLLNIARASQKHPLYFTEVGSVSRTISSSATVGAVDAPFGGSAPSTFKIPLTFGASGGPTVSLGVLNNDAKFMRGIMTPLTFDVLKYFWDQGWNKEALLLLFVRRAVVEVSAQESRAFEGFPGDRRKYEQYQDFMRCLAWDFVLRGDPTGEVVGSPMDAKAAQDPELLEVATKEGYALVKTKDKDEWTLQKSDRSLKFVRESSAKEPRCAWVFEPSPTDGAPRAASTKLEAIETLEADHERPASLAAPGKDYPRLRLYLRSPEAIIYHLGEIAREQLDHPGAEPFPLLSVLTGGVPRPVPLFVVRGCGERGGCCDPFVSYCGRSYSISSSPAAGESMHVLSLLSQVLGLFKSAEALPKGGVLTLVGG